jgi:hypothetical protein
MSATSTLGIALLCAVPLVAGVDGCACDPAKPETMAARECALCRLAEQQPPEPAIFFVKDNNPRKPNRWLVLPRRHGERGHHLQDMTPAERTALWKAAIQKGKELWGDQWGLAYNGPKVRTQCHAHIHIGKLLKGVETRRFVVVSKPEQIPVPRGEGVWIHPVGKKLHVHLGEQTCETVLFR